MTPPTKPVIKSDLQTTPLWLKWMERRQKRRRENSERQMNGLIKELNRIQDYGICVEAAITEAIESGWIGIKLEWLDAYKAKGNGKINFDDDNAIVAKCRELGITTDGKNRKQLITSIQNAN